MPVPWRLWLSSFLGWCAAVLLLLAGVRVGGEWSGTVLALTGLSAGGAVGLWWEARV